MLPVAEVHTIVKSPFQKHSSFVFPWYSNISASELDPEQRWLPISVRARRAADGYSYVLLSKVFLSGWIFTDINPLIFVCLAVKLHMRV